MSEPMAIEVRPTWRGRMHAWTFALAIPAGILLIARSHHTSARVAASIYVASVLALFGTSAAYHRLAHSERARAIMRRLDHSMIYVLIAGTYVPLCLVALPPAWGIPLLCVVSVAAVTGVTLKLFAFGRMRWLSYALYPIIGWTAVLAGPALLQALTPTQLALVVVGGVLYTVGIPVLLLRRPDPWPRTFGYHEVWHSFTIAAGACHFAAVGLVVM